VFLFSARTSAQVTRPGSGKKVDTPLLEFEGGGGYVFGGFATEILVSRRLTRFFGVKTGLTVDFNSETNTYQPIVLGTVGF